MIRLFIITFTLTRDNKTGYSVNGCLLLLLTVWWCVACFATSHIYHDMIVNYHVYEAGKKIYLCEHLQRMAQDAYKHISNSIFALLRLVELCSYIALFSSACPRFAIFLPYCVRIVWKHLQTEFISLPLNRMYDIKRGIHVEISSFSILNCIKMSLMQLFCLSTTVEATGEIVHTNVNAISMPTANSQRFDRMCTTHDEKS